MLATEFKKKKGLTGAQQPPTPRVKRPDAENLNIRYLVAQYDAAVTEAKTTAILDLQQRKGRENYPTEKAPQQPSKISIGDAENISVAAHLAGLTNDK